MLPATPFQALNVFHFVFAIFFCLCHHQNILFFFFLLALNLSLVGFFLKSPLPQEQVGQYLCIPTFKLVKWNEVSAGTVFPSEISTIIGQKCFQSY